VQSWISFVIVALLVLSFFLFFFSSCLIFFVCGRVGFDLVLSASSYPSHKLFRVSTILAQSSTSHLPSIFVSITVYIIKLCYAVQAAQFSQIVVFCGRFVHGQEPRKFTYSSIVKLLSFAHCWRLYACPPTYGCTEP
jgi:hypothetical protein